jgi:hypothetical protein
LLDANPQAPPKKAKKAKAVALVGRPVNRELAKAYRILMRLPPDALDPRWHYWLAVQIAGAIKKP